MPNRLIREGLMESEAVLSLPVEARWLFVTIMLSADDVGLFEATEFRLARRADVNRDLAGKLLQMIADVDLIRLYAVDGKRYGFIPKFGQRVQIKRTRHPLPPAALMADDFDASKKINDLAIATTVAEQLDNGCTSDGQPSEPEVEVGKKSIRNPSGYSSSRRQKATYKGPPCPVDEVIAAYHEILPEWPRVRIVKEKRREGIAGLWKWVLTSNKSDGSRRAETTEQGMEWMRSYFHRARNNDFLMGRVPRGAEHKNWEPDIDFIVSDKGLLQVVEKTKDAA